MARDEELAQIAKHHGANYSLRIIREARRAKVPISLAFAIVEQESNFQNVFGHDPTIFVGAGKVTKEKYLAYKKQRGSRGQGGMQGVGPMQLTWYEFQDDADRLGGCWVAANNIRVGLTLLGKLIVNHGTRTGVARYNGTGPQANRYATEVLEKQEKWHRRFT
jgi:hypothetical protein